MGPRVFEQSARRVADTEAVRAFRRVSSAIDGLAAAVASVEEFDRTGFAADAMPRYEAARDLLIGVLAVFEGHVHAVVDVEADPAASGERERDPRVVVVADAAGPVADLGAGLEPGPSGPGVVEPFGDAAEGFVAVDGGSGFVAPPVVVDEDGDAASVVSPPVPRTPDAVDDASLLYAYGLGDCSERFATVQKRGAHRRHSHPGWNAAPPAPDRPAAPPPVPDAPLAEVTAPLDRIEMPAPDRLGRSFAERVTSPAAGLSPLLCRCGHAMRMHERDAAAEHGRGVCMAGKYGGDGCAEFRLPT